MKGYYFITDRSLSRAGILSDVRRAVAAGVEAVQYRDKQASTRSMCQEAARLRQICVNTLFLINDRVDVALAVGADGVHLGQEDMPYERARALLGPESVIGVTVHDLAEAEAAYLSGADYLGLSPVFSTETKTDAGKPSGISLIRTVREKIPLPLVAIGGITLDNAPEVIAAGADALCAISAVVTADDVQEKIREFQTLFKER